MAISAFISSNSSERTVLCTGNRTQMYRNRFFFSIFSSLFHSRCNFVNDSFYPPPPKFFPTKLKGFPSHVSERFVGEHSRTQPKL